MSHDRFWTEERQSSTHNRACRSKAYAPNCALPVPQVPFLEYTADSATIVTGGVFEGRVRLWDARTGEWITEFLTGRTEQQGFINIHPDGRRMVALSGDDTVRV
jgi:WD40 repeat protein